MRHNRGNQDPRPMKAKFKSTCSKCKGTIERNEPIIYWPATRTATHLECGEEDYRTFLSSVQDELVYNGGAL